mmetsp:Transcript_5700/g.6627  ORF Transcript_5700/g.6627 Transcript_5700/m.6627 type:complete len:108 (+) Transcript_5700:120-443(+)
MVRLHWCHNAWHGHRDQNRDVPGLALPERGTNAAVGVGPFLSTLYVHCPWWRKHEEEKKKDEDKEEEKDEDEEECSSNNEDGASKKSPIRFDTRGDILWLLYQTILG